MLTHQIFARDLTSLERQIIMAAPEEMLQIVNNRNLEKELLATYLYIEEFQEKELMDMVFSAFPGISENECIFIILKLGLVVSFGSRNEDAMKMGLDIIDLIKEVEYNIYMDDLTEELEEFVNSTYWADCYAFYQSFDPEAFIEEYFPDFF